MLMMMMMMRSKEKMMKKWMRKKQHKEKRKKKKKKEEGEEGQPLLTSGKNGKDKSRRRSRRIRRRLSEVDWRAAFLHQLQRYVPVVEWLPRYQWRRDGAAEAVAGVCVALMLVPQCLAYAMVAGLPANVGLYAGFFPVIVYAGLGTGRQLAVGPEGLLSLLTGSVLRGFA